MDIVLSTKGVEQPTNKRGVFAKLNEEEQYFFDIALKGLFDNDDLKDNLMIDQRSDNYKTLSYTINYDFLRFKIGKRTKWFSIIPAPKDKEDDRFSCVENKRFIHWKISLDSIESSRNYADLIINSAYYAKLNSEK